MENYLKTSDESFSLRNRARYQRLYTIDEGQVLKGWGKMKIYYGLPKQQADHEPNGNKKGNEHDLIVIFPAGLFTKKHLEKDIAAKRKYH